MRRALLIAWLAWAVAPAFAEVDFLEPHDVQVVVERHGDQWTAVYRFDRAAKAWLFPRTSATTTGDDRWRARTWTLETPGLSIERRGAFDVLAARRGDVPVEVRLRFTPLAAKLADDYTPALRFTDGGVALFTGQFDVFPLRDAREASRLPGDLNGVLMPITRLSMTFSDGRVKQDHSGDSPVYVFLGPTRPVANAEVTALLDPQLPQWLHGALAEAVPALIAQYARRMGPPAVGKPTVIVSWNGPTPGFTRRTGGALPGQIVMEYEGAGLLADTPERRAEDLWFVAHEAAHFWLGQTVAYQYAREAWITEGGADLLALRAIQDLKLPFDWRAALNQSIADCAALTLRRGVESARERGEQRAYYACGAVLGLVAEGVTRQPFDSFVRRLVEANRDDKIVSREDWIKVLGPAASGGLARDIARLLDRGDSDPPALLASLLRRAGVDFELDDKRLPRVR